MEQTGQKDALGKLAEAVGDAQAEAILAGTEPKDPADANRLLSFMKTEEGKEVRRFVPQLRPWCSVMADSTRSLSIMANGKVTTCCYDGTCANAFANMHEEDIRSVWKKFVGILTGDLYKMPVCRDKCIGLRLPWSPPLLSRGTEAQELLANPPFLPKRLAVEPHSGCNYACEGCPATWVKHQAADLPRIHENLLEALPTCEWLSLGLYGEPLLNKALPQFVKNCRKHAPNMVIQVLTNGTPLTAKVVETFIDAKVDLVTVGIHAGPFTENMLRYSKRGADYDLVLHNIRSAVSAREARGENKPAIEVRTVLFNWNDTDELMEQLRNDVRAAGVGRHKAFDRLYWSLDVAGYENPRSSKRFYQESPDLKALVERGEFNPC